MSAHLDDVLTETDLTGDDVKALHRGGCTPSEIAARVNAQAMRSVSGAAVRDWLYDNGFPLCAQPAGRGMCEAPSDGKSKPTRCRACVAAHTERLERRIGGAA